ncbi:MULTISPECIES: Ppx/GppA phosphatase family protein [Streptomyces]|uniref:Exopolyphosphatase n=1 Tax=Streptomyces albus (strain ATCC 21838 / DSM 41398 / FERM P-419 / JCM 4703 / NBRC 107858) TaxID=1081613 RepID=A0A0B5EVE5_STRA4|nr:Ppx/GppA phosphatase family protein [Streptomyces sp. SCSIO ZS0520]AJE83215.1 exopolyphosphatase [Streptomyces albus]AOU77528.1 exopolyphosphatase [Streptomyces albus]AYN33299.1 exopolyphosphatase [Streptomyces albus]
MRLGVLDVGSNTVHLLVVDAHPGARPLPAHSHKAELRLAELLDEAGAIGPEGVDRLTATVRGALEAAEDKGVEDLLTFATSAVREAVNAEEVLARVKEETGVALTVLTGAEEARLTFLAARRWFGWSSGRLLVLDIGGGSLEIAYGMDEEPDAAVSLPLGAGRLTSGWLPGDPPEAEAVRALRRHARAEIARVVGEFSRLGRPDHVVATSKTFKQLARLAGAARSAEGLYVQRELGREALESWVPQLAAMTAEERAKLPGVSEGRSGQLLAGALVAEGAMDLFDVDTLEICPWALREGVILRHLDQMPPGPAALGPGAAAAGRYGERHS